MDFGWDTRPIPLSRHARDWRPQIGTGSSSTSPPPFSSLSAFSQRRRSSATQMPPAAPPPTQPIPNVPVLTPSTPASALDNSADYFPRINGHNSNSMSSSHPATFPRSRTESFSTSYEMSSSSSPENLSDPPPRSILHIVSSSSRDPLHRQDYVSDRLLLSPQDPQPRSEHRPSSRRALTRALELAKEAVKLDSTNTDPYGAVVAYGQSVALLSDVMERVRRGEDSTESSQRRRNGRRRSVVAQEEEVRRLKSIHDTYADRMNILSLIYSIPPIPHSPSSVYASTMSISSNSTQPPSPTTSVSPDSPERVAPAETQSSIQDDRYRYWENMDGREGVEILGLESRAWNSRGSLESENIASISQTTATTGRVVPISQSSSSYHPYAVVDLANQVTPTNMVHPITRAPSSPPVRRPRASSNLPPPPPPPLTSPPPPPGPVVLEPPLEPSSSQIPQHVEISRTREGVLPGTRLAALEEEIEKFEEPDSQSQQPQHPYRSYENDTAIDPKNLAPDASRVLTRDSPLPALPSSTSLVSGSVPGSNGVMDRAPPSPGSPNFMASRPRGTSTLSLRSETSSQQQLINPSPIMGTISQRRSKTSAPPSSGSPSPTEPSSAAAVVGQKPTPTSTPSNAASNLIIGRARSSSQPGRRPSLVNGRISPHDLRPPLPVSVTPNGSVVPRKPSFPSKLNPSLQGPQTSDSSPLTRAPPAALLIPPPPVVQVNLPTTPVSPLPPAPPTDALRKPYHLMNLLRVTMTSRSGGYITRRLHVPLEVWSQGGAKLTNVLEKVRVVDVLCAAFEELEASSVEYFGAGNVSSGLALGIGSIGRREGELWVGKLEEFSSVCDGVVGNFGKKLGVGEGFVIKKTSGVTSWGGKLTRQLDKFTNGKNLDSPAEYVQGLTKLFSHAQLLDEHTKALSCQPMAPAYAAFPVDIRLAAEVKLKRTSEFFARVVLTFVVRDLSQLLDKYVKKCEKWLAE